MKIKGEFLLAENGGGSRQIFFWADFQIRIPLKLSPTFNFLNELNTLPRGMRKQCSISIEDLCELN
jgi:hypothetical protein